METSVTTNLWALVESALNGDLQTVAEAADHCPADLSCFLRGLLLFEAEPEAGKDLFARAARSEDCELADQAAIYEARCFEYTSQWEEGRIMIREVLKRDLTPRLRGHALFVLACLQSNMPKRALGTLDEIEIDHLCAGLKGRVYTVRGRMQGRLKRYDSALIEYAGAVSFYEEAGHITGAAHAHNNRAGIFRRQRNYAEAHESVDTAISLISESDPFMPEFLDQKARIYNDEKNYIHAADLAERASRIASGSTKGHVLCECLCTLGIASAGLKNYATAGAAFARAKEVAEEFNSTEMMLEVAKSRFEAAGMVLKDSEIEMVELALTLCSGSYRAAAERIDFSHTGIMKLLKRNSREWKPKRPKAVISKAHK